MSAPSIPPANAPLSSDESHIHALYRALLDGWNRRNAHDFAAVFAEDANVVGFDGSQRYFITLCISVFSLPERKNRNTYKMASTMLPQANRHLSTAARAA